MKRIGGSPATVSNNEQLLKKRSETNAATAMDGAQQEDSQYRLSRIGKRIKNAREKIVYDLRGGDVFLLAAAWICPSLREGDE